MSNSQDQRREQVSAYPYVALVTHSSGIHPSTSRLIALDALTFNDEGETGESIHVLVNPGKKADPGPYHQHGYTHEDVSQGKRFSQVLRLVDRIIDDRILIVHNAPQTWGFIVSEARRTMNAAARANRARQKNNRGRNRRRQRVGHIPRPEIIVDTLESTRRQGLEITDVRIAGVARSLGLEAPSPVASVERTELAPEDVIRQETLLTRDMYFRLRESGTLAKRSPKDVRADRFGLQRSHVRIDALEAPRPVENPGKWDPSQPLQEGMEFVLAPEVRIDPNQLIEAGMQAGLSYSEKLSRETSLVVCNLKSGDPLLEGKGMHAARKEIALVSDKDFLHAVGHMN